MYVDPDPDLNEALVEALAASQREISDRVYVDWNGDKQFSHAWSDLSLVTSQVTLEHPTLVTDQPEDINAFVGYSSAELVVTLSGNRYSDESTVDVALSRFNTSGPFYNRDLAGAVIKYEQRVQTAKGPVDIRRFTGWIRDVQISHKAATVTITASNAFPWTSGSATLPRWARDSIAMGNDAGANRPINASWVITEMLRQAGTSMLPAERDDCLLYVMGTGSVLPSVGDITNLYCVETDFHRLTSDPLPSMTFEEGLPAPALTRVNGAEWATARAAHSNVPCTNRDRGWITVPRRGVTTDAPVNLGFTHFALSNGGTDEKTSMTRGSGSLYAFSLRGLDTVSDVNVQVAANGQVFVQILNDDVTWNWGWHAQPEGLHHYDVNIRFTYNNVAVTLTVDGVNQGLKPYGAGANNGYLYGSGQYLTVGPDWQPTNRCGLFIWDPAVGFQVYGGPPSTAVYRPEQAEFSTTVDGLPWAIVDASAAELSWLPNVVKEPPWTVLQQVATAELATMVINENGQLVYRPRYVSEGSTSLQPQARYATGEILDLVTNPSLDQYRNQITVSYSDGYQYVGDVWQNDSPFDLFARGDNIRTLAGPFPVSDVVSVAWHPFVNIGWQDSDNNGQGTNFHRQNTGVTTAVLASDLTLDAADPNHNNSLDDNWTSQPYIQLAADQRSISVSLLATAARSLYYGARVIESDGSSPAPVPATSFNVRGKIMSTGNVSEYTGGDSVEIADKGVRSLRLEAYDWRQTKGTAQLVVTYLLPETTIPAPTIDGLKVATEPRLSIGDIIAVSPGEAFSSDIIVQIAGLYDDAAEGTTAISGRIIYTPSTWALGIEGLSELGVTTVLG